VIEIKDGGPAFPCQATINRDSGELIPHQFGNDDFVVPSMSLRDYFAAKALQGAIHHRGFATIDDNRNMDAKDAYAYADAMLRARGAQ
jgi:hypothetical protein